MAKKKYWQSFSELTNPEAHHKLAANEFQEELPFESADSQGLISSSASRRDFLKYLGFSTAAAIAAASCETPVRKVIPYVNKPQDLFPGVADWYATTFVSGGEALPIVAKVRDGRPIKIEGNTLSAFSKGGTTARSQASVLDLYDTGRLRHPMANGSAVAYDAIDRLIAADLASPGGSPVVLLTTTVNSPTNKQIITEFLAKYPGSRHVQADAVSYSGMLLANEASYSKRAIPSYRFENADVVVSLGADFLGTWINPVEHQLAYSSRRKVSVKNQEMSKHYQFESTLSTTGASADNRYTHRPSETGVVAAALLSAVNGQGAAGLEGKLKAGIEKAAKDLLDHKGKALVISGSNNVNVQIIVNAINEAIGANGTTINWASPIQSHQGIDADMATLVGDMEAGKVGALLIYGANPAYEYFDGERFKKAIRNVKLTVSFNDRMDETTELCKYVLPAPHFLESWGDAEPKAGHVSMMQPTINPLFQTRPFQDSLLKWSGNNTEYDVYFRTYWTGKLGGDTAYEKALQDGVVETIAAPAGGSYNRGRVAEAVTAASALKKNSKAELVIYQKVGMGDGKQSNNPWLLELPDPITRATWDNYAMISPQLAKELKIEVGMEYEVHPEKPVVKFTAANKTVELPILVIPGMNPNTIAIAVGYGRSPKVGRAVVNADKNPVGKNAYPFLQYNGTTVDWYLTDVAYENTGNTYEIAQTQVHNKTEGRTEVVKELTLEEFKKDPQVVQKEREEEMKPFGGIANFAKEGTFYPMYDRPGLKWGMSIDLNSCFGCGACVVACHIENNVPIVGKNEVKRYHDMHWLRIDRYFSGNPDDPESIQTVFQPMLCQHCDNAPCENVCPVAATNHSSEGINQMAYNRCIGTRYCANNCPYKVRRFNWADYTGADSFPDNQRQVLEDVVMMMNDDLSRMVLNPDVVVRSHGVMEKCSFCVQRVQEGKLKAKKENRPLEDRDAQTACQQACASDAIVWGNVNNTQSAVNQHRKEYAERMFYVIEETHTLPNVSYLARVRNTEVVSSAVEYGEPGEQNPKKETEEKHA